MHSQFKNVKMSSECEICGKQDSSIKAIVEGSLVNVCSQCAKFGEIVEICKQTEKIAEKPLKKRVLHFEQEFEILKPNYAELIKKARELMCLTQEETAKLISEKESIYQKIESGNFNPSIAVAKKLERFFKIKLIDNYKEPEKTRAIDVSDSELTIGDLLKFKK